MFLMLSVASLSAIGGVLLEMVTHDKPFRLLQYFTIQSNFIAGFAGFAYLIGPGEFTTKLLQSSVLWMLVTGIIFHGMISKFYKPTGFKWISNHLTHTATPLLYLLVLFILDAPMETTLLWISYPLLYTGFWLAYGHFKDYYPYWFLRPNGMYPDGMGSYPKVIGFIAVMSFSFILLGLGLAYLVGK